MIGKLKGVINSYGEDFIILDVQGVGYQVHCSARTLQALPAKGEAVTLSIETLCARRPDQAVRLPERCRARMVPTAADGAGRRRESGALGAGTLTPSDLANAIALRDKAAVSRAQGVGAKVAERIVTELKDKVPAFSDLDPAFVHLSGALEDRGAAADPRRGLGFGQSRLRPAAGGRGDRRRVTRCRRGRRHTKPDPLGLKELARDDPCLYVRCRATGAALESRGQWR